MSLVTYSTLSNFDNGLSLSKLSSEINLNSALSTKFTNLSKFNNDVRVFLNADLTAGELTDLNTIVSNHEYIIENFENIISFSPVTTPIQSPTFFRRIGSITYDPNNRSSTLIKVELISFIDSGITSYDVRFVDVTNNNILATDNFNNITEATIELNQISSIPTNQAILEVHVKTNGGGVNDYLYTNSIKVYIG